MTLMTEVVCPFCSLLCDDLSVEDNDSQLRISSTCGRSIRAYKAFNRKPTARINNSETNIENAIKEATRIIKRSKYPLLAGLGTDVTGMRSIMQLADKTGAYLDHMHGGSISNYSVLQDKGYMLTTLGEIKNRADLILCVGTDVVSYWDRFFEKFVWTDKTLTDLDPSNREIVYIGNRLKTSPGVRPDGRKPFHLKCQNEETGEVIGALRAIMAGKKLSSRTIAGIGIKKLHELAALIENCKFGVLLWSASNLAPDSADLQIQTFTEFVKERNVEKRFSSMPIASSDGAMSAYSTAAWQSGFPLRTRFLKGYPEYNPHKYQTDNLIKQDTIDLLIWVSSFGSKTPPPKFHGPTIILADGNSAIEHEPDVFIPISTPGVDQSGQMQRADSVVSLNMKAVIDTAQPKLSDVVETIMQKL